MEKETHSQGPWTQEDTETPNGVMVKIKSASGGVVCLVKSACGRKRANARLIAAAPKLLNAAEMSLLAVRVEWDKEAREELMQRGWQHFPDFTALEYAEHMNRAAIDEARGEA